MFGAAGVFSSEAMFALLADEIVYLKADAELRRALEAEGGAPFRYTQTKTGKTIEMGYVSLPEAALDDPEIASAWGRKSLDLALEAQSKRKKSEA